MRTPTNSRGSLNAEMKNVVANLAGSKASQERAGLQSMDWAADIDAMLAAAERSSKKR